MSMSLEVEFMICIFCCICTGYNILLRSCGFSQNIAHKRSIHMSVLSSYFSLIESILEPMIISICRKLSRSWNNFELMVSIPLFHIDCSGF